MRPTASLRVNGPAYPLVTSVESLYRPAKRILDGVSGRTKSSRPRGRDRAPVMISAVFKEEVRCRGKGVKLCAMITTSSRSFLALGVMQMRPPSKRDDPCLMTMRSGATRDLITSSVLRTGCTYDSNVRLAMPGRSMSSPFPWPKGMRMGEAVVPDNAEMIGMTGYCVSG